MIFLLVIVLPFYQGKAAKSGEGSATTYTVSMMVCLAHKCQPAIKTLKKQEGVVTWDLKVLAQVFGKICLPKTHHIPQLSLPPRDFYFPLANKFSSKLVK